jgi:hypothetical protein
MVHSPITAKSAVEAAEWAGAIGSVLRDSAVAQEVRRAAIRRAIAGVRIFLEAAVFEGFMIFGGCVVMETKSPSGSKP